MEAELKVGAMGFDEGYVSIVEAKKWQSVSVSPPSREWSESGRVG